MNITINGSNNTIIDLSGVSTFGELKQRLPGTGNGRVPGINQLRKKATVVLRKETPSGVIEIYDNGFYTFEECDNLTVFAVDRCERPETYTYSGRKEAGMETQDFSPYPWDLILESAGSARLAHNADSRDEYQSEISMDAPESENNPAFSVKPEHEIREEEENAAAWRAHRIEMMKQAMEKPTERQREIAMMYFRAHKTQEEIAAEIGKSQQYVSKTINRYQEIVNQAIK